MISVIPTTSSDYKTVQNMAQFYVYDASRDCGFSISANGKFEPNDYKGYFEEQRKKSYLVKVNDEIAGFVLLNQAGIRPNTEWKIDQFFILAKFQGKGIGRNVAYQIWSMYPNLWELLVLPKNKSALFFWRKIIADFTGGDYLEETIDIDIKDSSYDKSQSKRIIFSFNTQNRGITL